MNDHTRKRVLNDKSDEQLMSLYRQGNTEAFSELYRRNKAPLYRYFLRQTRHGAIAEELSQDVWTNIVRSRQSYKSTAKFTTYLYQVAHNRLVDHIRRSQSRPVENLTAISLTQATDPNNKDCEPSRSSDQPEQQAQSLEAGQRLLTLLQQLPEEQREAFILKEEAGLSLLEIASVTGVNVETAKSRLRYAVAKLKEGMVGFL
ncbi:MAG: sigma-70 family RNA polymerase sigma factor [Gammaproteobacteria bacterium]|nr:sigma-70 family RNA polymerase sigma factor [Gammaproteobacteria bacterium]MDH5801917.1 sigma-70 family RNA polymerase sigma factor [Gammaproteobacteria bacterium]